MKKYNNNGAVPIVCVYDEMAGGGGRACTGATRWRWKPLARDTNSGKGKHCLHISGHIRVFYPYSWIRALRMKPRTLYIRASHLTTELHC